MRKIVTVFIFFVINLLIAQTTNVKSFTARTTPSVISANGNFTMLGNTNLTLENYDDFASNGNTNSMIYVDVDSDTLTVNSSSADFTIVSENGSLPECDSIIYAGLYWSGRAHFGNEVSTMSFNVDAVNNVITTITLDKRKVQLKGPGSTTYTEITANDNDIYYPESLHGKMYSAMANVTDYVRQHGVGTYTVANIALNEAQTSDGTGLYGGWGMVVIYYNTKMNKRNITLFDGHSHVVFQSGGNNSADIVVDGIQTIPVGPVTMRLGLMAGEGDVGVSGDFFQIKRNDNGVYQNLSHSLNLTNNFFNSSINVAGNPPRNPLIQNNTGMDICMFDIPNSGNAVIGNNQNSVTYRYGTAQDTYIIYCMAMSVDTYKPTPEAIMSVASIDGNPPTGTSPYTVTPGQIIEYKVDFINPSNEDVLNTYIDIPVPFPTEYVAGSASGILDASVPTSYTPPVFNATQGAYGTLHWQIGTLPMDLVNPNKILATLTYKVKITEDCRLLKSPMCSTNVITSGTIYGIGSISQINLFDDDDTEPGKSTITGIEETGCGTEFIRGTLETIVDSDEFVNDHCQEVNPNYTFVSCVTSPLSFAIITQDMPNNVKIYNQFPVTSSATQYSATNNFPTTIGTTNYYVVPEGSPNCYLPLSITYNPVPTATITGTEVCFSSVAPSVTFTAQNGTAPYTFTYQYQGNTLQVTTSSNTANVTVPNTVGTHTYTLLKVEDTNGCYTDYTISADVIINPIPDALLSSNQSICISDTAPTITITGSNGTLPYTFDYTLNGSAQSISTSSTSNQVTINVPNVAGTYLYQLTNVKDAKNCSQTKTESVTVVINPTPTATIAITDDAICVGDTNVIVTFTAQNGTAPYTFTFNNNGILQTQTTSGNTYQISVPNSVGVYNYTLLKIEDANGCFSTYNDTKQVTVHPLPVLTLYQEAICDDNLDGIYTYTLTDINDNIVTNPSLYSFQYFISQADAISGNNAITNPSNYSLGTTLPQIIWIKVTNSSTICNNITSVTFTANAVQNLGTASTVESCATGVLTAAGFAIFDLTLQENTINPNGTQFTYYTTQSAANSGGTSSIISNPTAFQNTIANTQTVWVRVQENGKCDAVTFINLSVKALPYSTTLSDEFICMNDVIILDAGTDFASYQWYFNDSILTGETQHFLDNVNEPGIYEVDLIGFNGCQYKQKITVTRSTLPYITDINYGNGWVEFIGAGGIPPYSYSIDGAPFVTQNLFYLNAGLYNVTIKSNTCEGETMPVPVIAWATIFTPNGDRKNDTWKVRGLEFTETPKVTLFDRYGKEISKLDEITGFEWNGKYLGRPLPSTSYWFIIGFTNPYILKSYLFNGYVVVKDRNAGDELPSRTQ